MQKSLEAIRGTFNKYAHFGFFIPDKRDQYGGDFFVNAKNDAGALDGQRVIARPLKKTKGKKPEAKIIELLNKKTSDSKLPDVKKNIEGIYVQVNEEFGFVEVEGKEKGYFVHASKKATASHGNTVKAEIASYNGKQEAIILEVLDTQESTITGELKDSGDFGFVFTKKGKPDIFISASNYNGAKGGDTVLVKVTKTSGRRPEGVVIDKKQAD